jgi:acetyl esterase/lipase
MYGDSKDIGYITIFVGQKESFIEQCRKYHEKLNSENIKHTYVERAEMFHDYPIFPLKESKDDFELISNLIIK